VHDNYADNHDNYDDNHDNDDHESRITINFTLSSLYILHHVYCCYLDLLNYRIERGGIRCVQLSGSMNIGDLQNLIPTYPHSNDVMMIIEQRDQTIQAFKSNPDIKVMLISLKAGTFILCLSICTQLAVLSISLCVTV